MISNLLKLLGGVKAIFPPHNPPSAYSGMYWQDANGDFTASITSHEKTNDGKHDHNHLTIKTARSDRTSNKDRSRMHVTHGHEVAQIQVTEYAELVVFSRIILRGDNGKFYALKIDKNGVVKSSLVPSSDIQFSKD